MQLGLIPTNNGYGKLFNNLSISAQITDQNGTPVYASATSTPLTAEEFALKSGSRLKEHIVMHKMKIQGGYGIWQVDLAELDRLNEELEEAKEGLSEETELIIKKKSKIILLVDVNILQILHTYNCKIIGG